MTSLHKSPCARQVHEPELKLEIKILSKLVVPNNGIAYLVFILFLLACTQASGQTHFTEKAVISGVDHYFLNTIPMGGGVAWFDFDNDGDEDIWITGGIKRDGLFKNNADGTFSEVGGSAGLDATDSVTTNGVVTGDIDNDGDRDVFVTTMTEYHNLLFINNGNGTFSEVSLTAGVGQDSVYSTVAAFGDINLDGYLDLYVGNYVSEAGVLIDSITGDPIGFDHRCFPNFLFLNNGPDSLSGEISFSDISQILSPQDTGCALATTFTDFDNDHDPDIYLANDFGEWVVPNQLYRNDFPLQQITDVSQASGMDAQMYGMGIAIGDYDQDLDLDYYVTNIGRNRLSENQGDGTFLDETTSAGVEDIYADSLFTVGWGCFFADMDNDTDLDLLVTNGYVPAFDFIKNNYHNPDRFFLNEGNKTFVERGEMFGVRDTAKGRGSAFADYDMDGDLDYMVVPTNDNPDPDSIKKIRLYQNELSTSSNWLKAKLQGSINNRDGFGSQIKIVLSDRSWIHEVSGGSSHGSQNSSIAHFGLGSATMVDTLVITWPGGAEQLLTAISSNQMITIVEDSTLTSLQDNLQDEAVIQLRAFPNPFSKRVQIVFTCFKSSVVSLSIYNFQGQLVGNIYQGKDCRGEQSFNWNGQDDLGQKLSPGIYFIRLTLDRYSYSLPVVLSY